MVNSTTAFQIMRSSSFSVAVGFFFVSLISHSYIRFGWDRDGARQIDKQATAAMEMNGLPSEGGSQAERKRKLRGAGRWLSAANKAA